jgi:hypothetical protein
LDEAVDAYVDWREESTAVWDAYGRWTRASAGDAPLAFSAYRAAVDREEQASRVYASFMERIATALSAESASSSSGRSLGWRLLVWGGRITLVALFVIASISMAAQA